jgi:AcrR family transcriptional regulator
LSTGTAPPNPDPTPNSGTGPGPDLSLASAPEPAFGSEPAAPTRRPRADAQRNRALILAAAEAVFARDGAAGSTEQVAAQAGVAIGTVFRHFPTKQALLQAIMKDLLARLAADAAELAEHGDPATALFEFFTRLVGQAARKQSVVGLLADAGAALSVGASVQSLGEQIGQLLALAQSAGSVRADVRTETVAALIAGACQAALQGGWDEDLQADTLAVIFDGLRQTASESD